MPFIFYRKSQIVDVHSARMGFILSLNQKYNFKIQNNNTIQYIWT